MGFRRKVNNGTSTSTDSRDSPETLPDEFGDPSMGDLVPRPGKLHNLFGKNKIADWMVLALTLCICVLYRGLGCTTHNGIFGFPGVRGVIRHASQFVLRHSVDGEYDLFNSWRIVSWGERLYGTSAEPFCSH
jgi:hypothetical protein